MLTNVVKSTPFRCTADTESNVSIHFALRLTIFELQSILRHVHWIIPQRNMHPPMSKGRSPLCVTGASESQIRITDGSFRCMPNCFRITDYSWLQRLSAVLTVALTRSWRRKNVRSRNCHANRENWRIVLPKIYLCFQLAAVTFGPVGGGGGGGESDF